MAGIIRITNRERFKYYEMKSTRPKRKLTPWGWLEAIPFIYAISPASTADESLRHASIAHHRNQPRQKHQHHQSNKCLHIPLKRKRKLGRERRAVGAALVVAGLASRNPKSLIHCLSGFWGPDCSF